MASNNGKGNTKAKINDEMRGMPIFIIIIIEAKKQRGVLAPRRLHLEK